MMVYVSKIFYKTKQRFSPFDFSFDMFHLQICSKDKIYNLNFDSSVKKFLPQFATFLKRRGINVIDNNNIVELLISDKSLYEHFNKNQ